MNSLLVLIITVIGFYYPEQGMLLSDILEALDRYFQEAELWALCRECVISLQRKKKHLRKFVKKKNLLQ